MLWSTNEAGNKQRAYKHWIIAARAGHAKALNNMTFGHKHGLDTKEDYAQTLRAYQMSQDMMKSEARDKALAAHNQRMGG